MVQAIPPRPTVRDLEHDLREAVLDELANKGLKEPEHLAESLGIAPIKTASLLRRSHWSIETSVKIIEALNLPIGLDIVPAR